MNTGWVVQYRSMGRYWSFAGIRESRAEARHLARYYRNVAGYRRTRISRWTRTDY